MLNLISEVGDLAREVLILTNSNEHPADREGEIRTRLGMEIYDCVWNLCDLANILDVNLEAAFAQKAEINRTRRW
jgi:NTP pyrophosphatase (non-canonical NTP hydrolase)